MINVSSSITHVLYHVLYLSLSDQFSAGRQTDFLTDAHTARSRESRSAAGLQTVTFGLVNWSAPDSVLKIAVWLHSM